MEGLLPAALAPLSLPHARNWAKIRAPFTFALMRSRLPSAPAVLAVARRIFSWSLCSALGAALLPACTSRHWAPVEAASFAPPAGPVVLHTSGLVVHITDDTQEPQCVVAGEFRPVCYYQLREALEHALTHSLWPSFPAVRFGSPRDVRSGEYLLQVETWLDVLPPDEAGPGWSTGARTRFRLLRDQEVLLEETLASRSRAEFPYGAPLGAGATEVLQATVHHIASRVSQVEEREPYPTVPLPPVAAHAITTPTKESSPAAPPSEVAQMKTP